MTRREALLEALVGAGALALAGCDASPAPPSGSTLRSTWVDPVGDGQLRVGPGEPLADRTELGPRAAPVGVLVTFAHLTDAHVLDASSPARVTFLNRLGPPFQSTFRPQEALTAQVLAGAVAAIRRLRPQLVIQGGDLIDNAQNNELTHALSGLAGGPVQPGSGPDGYYGVQSEFDPDPFYYRPDVDAPRHPGLLRAAVRPFRSRGSRRAHRAGARRPRHARGRRDRSDTAHARARGRRPGAVGAADRTDGAAERVARARGLTGRAAEPRPDR